MSDQITNMEDTVRDALRQVVDPEIGMDVIMLGLVRELDLQPDHSHVGMILTTPFCPFVHCVVPSKPSETVNVSAT